MSAVDQILQKYQAAYQKSVSHPLTNELCAGTLSDRRLFTYLVQDLKFFQVGMNLFGKALAYCDDAKSAIVLAKQIGFVANDENDYFTISLKELRESGNLEDTEMLADSPATLPAVQKYIDLMKYLAFESTSYVELITFVYVMEQVYLGWADYNIERGIAENLTYKHQEWINLHSGEAFEKWTQFLKDEVNRSVKTEEDLKLCDGIFIEAIEREIEFFDACFDY